MLWKNRFRKFLRYSVILYVILCLMVLICETADARAGGGGGYSGGGSSGGGGGGGGGAALVRLFIMLLRLCFEAPLIGIPLMAVFLTVLYLAYKYGNDQYENHVITKASDLYPSVSCQNALSRIKAKDPGFSEEDFSERAKKAFTIVQEGWSKRDLNRAEAFLADGTYEQFLIQLSVMKEMHKRDHMEGLKITSTQILNFESDGNFDAISLAISASCVNYFVDDKSGKYLSGNKNEEDFTEVWTFLRRTGTKTLGKPGLIEGFCPNCGAPISMGRHAKCSSCGSILRSGQHDWVLANITQACEWVGKSNKNIPGLQRFMEHDHGFNVQHIEDRTSVMFWRKSEAERIGDIKPLRKIAKDEFCDAQKQYYRNDSTGSRKFYSECAVGDIRVLAVDNVTNKAEDYVYVKVIWSGIPSRKASSGAITTGGEKQNFKHIFVLSRKHGVQTDTKTTLVSSHCPCCGAPETKSDSNMCEYCGSTMNDGTRDWVLEAVLTEYDVAITRGINLVKDADRQAMGGAVGSSSGLAAGAAGGKPAKPSYTVADYANISISGTNLLKWTIAMMLADGVIDNKELVIVYDLALRRGISRGQCDQYIEEIKAQPVPLEYVINSTDLPASMELLRSLIRVAFADGKLTSEEVDMLKYVGRKMNMSDSQMRDLLKTERERLYRISKAIIKESKNYN